MGDDQDVSRLQSQPLPAQRSTRYPVTPTLSVAVAEIVRLPFVFRTVPFAGLRLVITGAVVSAAFATVTETEADWPTLPAAS